MLLKPVNKNVLKWGRLATKGKKDKNSGKT